MPAVIHWRRVRCGWFIEQFLLRDTGATPENSLQHTASRAYCCAGRSGASRVVRIARRGSADHPPDTGLAVIVDGDRFLPQPEPARERVLVSPAAAVGRERVDVLGVPAAERHVVGGHRLAEDLHRATDGGEPGV